MDSQLNSINTTLMKLKIFSHNKFDPIVIYDEKIHDIAISYKQHNQTYIIINLNRLPYNHSVISHIIAHEFGHIFCGHVNENPKTKSPYELQQIEDEADTFASYFISFHPDIHKIDILRFFLRNHSGDKNSKYHRMFLLYRF